MSEEWKPIQGYDGLYEVSDLGRIRSLNRVVWRKSRSGNLYPWTRPGRVMMLFRSKGSPRSSHRYWQVLLSDTNGASHHHMVHLIVARTFFGPCPPGMECCHGAMGMLDNSIQNLSYGTRSENQRDRRRDGTSNLGERNPQAKLSPELAEEMRSRWRNGTTQKTLVEEFRVSKTTVSMTVRGLRWPT